MFAYQKNLRAAVRLEMENGGAKGGGRRGVKNRVNPKETYYFFKKKKKINIKKIDESFLTGIIRLGERISMTDEIQKAC